MNESTPTAGHRPIIEAWWQVAAALIAAGTAIVAVLVLFGETDSTAQRVLGPTLLSIGACTGVAGLLIRRHTRHVGSALTAAGVIPGIVPIVFYWFLPAVALGLFSMAVFVIALNDAVDAKRRLPIATLTSR